MTEAPKVELHGKVKIITFTGTRIQAGVDNVIATELVGQMNNGEDGHILLDFTHVESISSVELGTLIKLQKELMAAGTRLTLFNLSAHVFEVFSITRLHNYFRICREEAGA